MFARRLAVVGCRAAAKAAAGPAARPCLAPLGALRFKTGFAKSHEYLNLDGDTGKVGITEFAAAALGDVVYVELPDVGASFDAGQTFGSVESVKAASDVYSPVAGEVVEVNSALSETPSLVNSSAMEDGWFIKIKVKDPSEMSSLLDETAYKAHCDASKK